MTDIQIDTQAFIGRLLGEVQQLLTRALVAEVQVAALTAQLAAGGEPPEQAEQAGA